MELNEILQAISTVGFPIACCCYLFYSNEKQRQTFEKLSETIRQLQNAIENLQIMEKITKE